jgi:hypothetical protein
MLGVEHLGAVGSVLLREYGVTLENVCACQSPGGLMKVAWRLGAAGGIDAAAAHRRV